MDIRIRRQPLHTFLLLQLGRILAMYGGQQPHFEMVENLNLEKTFSDIIQVLFTSTFIVL
jgi:hypothetical protein